MYPASLASPTASSLPSVLPQENIPTTVETVCDRLNGLVSPSPGHPRGVLNRETAPHFIRAIVGDATVAPDAHDIRDALDGISSACSRLHTGNAIIVQEILEVLLHLFKQARGAGQVVQSGKGGSALPSHEDIREFLQPALRVSQDPAIRQLADSLDTVAFHNACDFLLSVGTLETRVIYRLHDGPPPSPEPASSRIFGHVGLVGLIAGQLPTKADLATFSRTNRIARDVTSAERLALWIDAQAQALSSPVTPDNLDKEQRFRVRNQQQADQELMRLLGQIRLLPRCDRHLPMRALAANFEKLLQNVPMDGQLATLEKFCNVMPLLPGSVQPAVAQAPSLSWLQPDKDGISPLFRRLDRNDAAGRKETLRQIARVLPVIVPDAQKRYQLLSARTPSWGPILYSLMQTGRSGAVRAFGYLLEKAVLSAQQQHELLAAKTADGTPGVVFALQNDHAEAVRAFGEILVRSDLDAAQKYELLAAKSADGRSGMLFALVKGHADALRAYGEIVIQAGLSQAQQFELLAVKGRLNGQSYDASKIAMGQGHIAAVDAMTEIWERVGLVSGDGSAMQIYRRLAVAAKAFGLDVQEFTTLLKSAVKRTAREELPVKARQVLNFFLDTRSAIKRKPDNNPETVVKSAKTT